MSRGLPTPSGGSSDTGGTPPTDDLAIDARDVHVTYADGTAAVRGVTLRIPDGECFGFLGPNGAGKTTTIETLVTLLHPTQGTVAVNGFDVVDRPQAVAESIGYMAQETSVDVELTARENLRFACRVHGVPAGQRDERIAELLELVGLADVADDRAQTFSGGMAKRLDAATALVHRPPVVFLDEPTTGLDPAARRRLWDHFEAINDRGTTVFLTTQYLEEVDRLCDRLAVIQDGEIVARDTPENLKATVGASVLELTLAERARSRREQVAATVEAVDTLATPRLEWSETGVTIRAENAREAAMDVFVALDAAGITATDVDVRSPTLDDVFLALTGSESTREDSAGTPARSAGGQSGSSTVGDLEARREGAAGRTPAVDE